MSNRKGRGFMYYFIYVKNLRVLARGCLLSRVVSVHDKNIANGQWRGIFKPSPLTLTDGAYAHCMPEWQGVDGGRFWGGYLSRHLSTFISPPLFIKLFNCPSNEPIREWQRASNFSVIICSKTYMYLQQNLMKVAGYFFNQVGCIISLKIKEAKLICRQKITAMIFKSLFFN